MELTYAVVLELACYWPWGAVPLHQGKWSSKSSQYIHNTSSEGCMGVFENLISISVATVLYGMSCYITVFRRQQYFMECHVILDSAITAPDCYCKSCGPVGIYIRTINDMILICLSFDSRTGAMAIYDVCFCMPVESILDEQDTFCLTGWKKNQI